NAFASIPGLAQGLGLEFLGSAAVALEPEGPTVADDMAILPTEHEYERRITGKTAALFATSAETGAILSASSEEQITALKRYRLAWGRAFQVVDDVLAFPSPEAELGKPVGSDIRQGHLPLPVILFAKANPAEWHDWVERVPQLVKGGDFIF